MVVIRMEETLLDMMCPALATLVLRDVGCWMAGRSFYEFSAIAVGQIATLVWRSMLTGGVQ